MDQKKDLIAGAVSSLISTFVMHPFDLVRLTQITNKTSILKTTSGILNGTPSSYFRVFNFYQALPVSMFAYITTYSIYFPINSWFKSANPLGIENKYLLYTFSTIPPTMIAMTLVNPLWTIKTKQMPTQDNKFPTFRESYHQIIEKSGVRGLYKGMLFGYINNINGLISFSLYDSFKDLIKPDQQIENTTLDFFICSVLSKSIATIVCYPFFKMRIQQQSDQVNTWSTIKTNVKAPSLLFNGLIITLLLQVPKNTILLMLFEFIKKI